jgi:hypothetical protein
LASGQKATAFGFGAKAQTKPGDNRWLGLVIAEPFPQTFLREKKRTPGRFASEIPRFFFKSKYIALYVLLLGTTTQSPHPKRTIID